MRDHQVIIVCGETGSGKTTQLPKICLEHGRGIRGMIGHTQPRRIAARSVATRIAQELATPMGEIVGYKVRFSDQTKPDAYIKLMTDGILLAETQSDRMLAAYDTIIIDEAHERNLNVDFLLGYLKQLLPRRPDLKLIITSATLDADRFARHFGDGTTSAPVIDVEGRMFPVEVRYRPLGAGEDPAGDNETGGEADDEEALEEAIVATAEDLWREGPGRHPGVSARRARNPRDGRASVAERLATALRVVGGGTAVVRALVGGTAAAGLRTEPRAPRRARYQRCRDLAHGSGHSLRDRFGSRARQALFAAQQGDAAADRKGIAGRGQSARRDAAAASRRGCACAFTTRSDFDARPKYTEPEILRSSLAAVILRMASLELGDVASFPFPEPPGPRAIADGYQLLQELGAVDTQRALTPLGRELARLPVDPRIGRIMLAARSTRLSRRSAGHRERAGSARSARPAHGQAPGGGSGALALPR